MHLSITNHNMWGGLAIQILFFILLLCQNMAIILPEMPRILLYIFKKFKFIINSYLLRNKNTEYIMEDQ